MTSDFCCFSSIVLATLFLLQPATTRAQSCDPQKIQADLQSRYAARIANAKTICETARVQIALLEDAKKGYSQCLRGKALQDTIAELDRVIQRAQQAKAEVGGC